MYKPKYQEVVAYLHNDEAKRAEVGRDEILISIEDVEIIIDRVVKNNAALSDVRNCGGGIPYDSLSASFKKSIEGLEE